MSTSILLSFVHILLFLLIFVKTDAQDCGYSIQPPGPPKTTDILPWNGDNATEGAWPWMAAIRKRNASGIYNPWCSGFLIDNKHVLSAAQCYEPRSSYKVRIGHVNQDLADEYNVILIVIPSNYTVARYYDDIAMLTLDREVNFPDFNPICLPDDKLWRKILNGRKTSVAGWRGNSLGEHKNILKNQDRLPVISNIECLRILRQNMKQNVIQRHFPRGVNQDILCTGAAGREECTGDSGGPLMLMDRNRWFAIGIVTFGYHCQFPANGYTNVTNYLEWIRENSID